MRPLIFLSLALASPLAASAHPESGAIIDPAPVLGDGTWQPVVHLEHPSFADDPEELLNLLETVASRAPFDALHIDPLVETDAGLVRLEDLLPPPPPLTEKYPEPPSAPVSHPGRADGALNGKAIYLSQCHGLIWYESLGRFSTQRPNLFSTIEDLHNPEAMSQVLTSYLENAGANVFTVKERDHNPVWTIVDNDDDTQRYSEAGGGFTTHRRGWGTPTGAIPFGHNPFDAGTSRRMPASEGGVASFTLTAPTTGMQAIYVSWVSGSDHAPDAHLRLTHGGGTIDRSFDQRVHGSTWQFLETLWLFEGEEITIEWVGDSAHADRFISVDAARIGGGTGVVSRFGQTTSRPRWEEGATLSTQFNGAPRGVYDPFSTNNNGNDVAARSRWASWESPAGEDAIYLSWHSNASAGGAARGTVTYIYEGGAGPPVTGSASLATAVQGEMILSFQSFWSPTWQDRGVRSAPFGEVNPGHNPKMPAALVELAFHDNAHDADYLKHPAFRRDASRAMYRGIVRYFAERDRVAPVFLPEPPVGLELVHSDNGELRLSWQAGPIGAPFGDAPTSYLVQTSSNGYQFSEGFSVSGTSTVLDAVPGQTIYARVIATNDGGRSFASEVMAGRRSPDGYAPVLIVDAFDRFETGQLDWDTIPWGIGNVMRFRPERVNPYNIINRHAEAISAAGWFYDSISDERLGDIDLDSYDLVVWATGEESTADETFSTTQQRLLRPWWERGGAIWTSGAEILWDLDARGSGEDRAFAQDVLGALLQADSAGTDRAHGVDLLEGLDLSFPAETSPYPVEWPDELTTTRPVIARYETGTVAAIFGERVALFGFPFESIGDREARIETARRLLPALVPDYDPPEAQEPRPGDPDEDPAETDRRLRIGSLSGCGCSTGAAPAGWALLLGAGWLHMRRRRRRCRA